MSEPEVAYIGGLPCQCPATYTPRLERFIDAFDQHVQTCDKPWVLTHMHLEGR